MGARDDLTIRISKSFEKAVEVIEVVEAVEVIEAADVIRAEKSLLRTSESSRYLNLVLF